MRRMLILLLALAGCGQGAGVGRFAGTEPAFDPLVFWAGHHTSWGVLEGAWGAPSAWVATDCVGTRLADGSLHMVQTLRDQDGAVTHRDWHLWQEGAGRFAATANDMVGVAHGVAAGRTFHWAWVLARAPGNPLKNVTLDQWMYAQPGGAMMNHTSIRFWGVPVAQVSEVFVGVR